MKCPRLPFNDAHAQDTKALKLSQRLAAWFLIHEGWADGPITAHPFASFLVNAAARPDAHAAERNLVLQVLQRVDFEEVSARSLDV